MLEVVRRRDPVKSAAETPKAAVPLVSDSIHLPVMLPVIVVHGTELPNISLDYTRRARDSSEMRITLERLSLVLRETRIDPAVPPKARRSLFSEQAIVSATALEAGNEARSILFGQVRANLTDSTLALDSVVIGPTLTDAEWLKQQKQRKDLIRIQLDSAAVPRGQLPPPGKHRGRRRGQADRGVRLQGARHQLQGPAGRPEEAAAVAAAVHGRPRPAGHHRHA